MPKIHIDDREVFRELADGAVISVAWEQLEEVSIVTTSAGPFADDVFYVLVGSAGTGCVIPLSAPECTLLVGRLHRLPGFDYEAAIHAMKCSEDASFVCWKRPPLTT